MPSRPLWELFRARMIEFRREPEVIFWVFCFPVLLAVGLGLAFRNKAPDEVVAAVVEGPGSDRVAAALAVAEGLRARVVSEPESAKLLRLGQVSVVVVPGVVLEYRYDPTRPDGTLARARVDDALQRAAGRTDPIAVRERRVSERGARYIDFLIPGLIGMNIMGGGMWGVGYILTEMRSRQLLKRLLATPMRRGDFLAALMASRIVVVLLQLILLLAFGRLAFDIPVQGSLLAVLALTLAGAFAFSGLGLLVASRARKVETVSGLMNLVMLPMYVFSGVFFSSDRFPEAMQPLVKALPLTALNDALRAVILEGAGLSSQAPRVAVMTVWGATASALAFRLFRWR